MMLSNKVAVIYGAGGAVGNAVAKTFAREGARIYLTGRNKQKLDIHAGQINKSGGFAEATQVDAMNEEAIGEHLRMVIEKAGAIDISFNAVGLRNTSLQGVPLVDLDLDHFMAPITTHIQSNFLTARCAGRIMAANGSGVIMTVTSTPSRVANALMGGVAIAMAAEEALIRNLSLELGQKGVRVVGVRTHGMPDSDTIREVFGLHASAYGISREQFQKTVEERTHRKQLPSLQEMAEVVAFMASGKASAMTGTMVNMSLGAIAD